jgi:hypothetical protein
MGTSQKSERAGQRKKKKSPHNRTKEFTGLGRWTHDYISSCLYHTQTTFARTSFHHYFFLHLIAFYFCLFRYPQFYNLDVARRENLEV